MRKELLERIQDIITLEELVAWTLNVTAEQMGWKKYYMFLNRKTKNITAKTKIQWCDLLNIDMQQLETAMQNQHA